ncbi:MAG: hypothetical protein H7061_00630 [Bdellovibrionaceae bacterium]|nr:hypothetical protein [Bdellovibrio sp.]
MNFAALIVTLAFSAQVFAATNLMSYTTVVGFAPPDYRGVYKTEVKSDGLIQYTDNKGVVTKIGALSEVAVKNLVKLISDLKPGPLQGADGPQCQDAPTTTIQVTKDAQEVVISHNAGCRTKQMTTASELVQLMNSAHSLSRLSKP